MPKDFQPLNNKDREISTSKQKGEEDFPPFKEGEEDFPPFNYREKRIFHF